MLKHFKKNKASYFWVAAFVLTLVMGTPSMLRDWQDNTKLQEQYRRLKLQKLSASLERDAIEDAKREAILDKLERKTCRIALQKEDPARYAKPKAGLKVDAMPGELVCFRSGNISIVQEDQELRYEGNIGQEAMQGVAQNVYEGSILISGAD